MGLSRCAAGRLQLASKSSREYYKEESRLAVFSNAMSIMKYLHLHADGSHSYLAATYFTNINITGRFQRNWTVST